MFWEEEIIPDDELDALQIGVEQLTSDILSSDLEESLKAAMIEGLESARLAILTYRVFGADRIRQAFNDNIALMFRHREEFSNAIEDEDEAVVREYFKVIGSMDRLLSFGLKVKQLAEHIPFVAMLAGD